MSLRSELRAACTAPLVRGWPGGTLVRFAYQTDAGLVFGRAERPAPPREQYHVPGAPGRCALLVSLKGDPQ